MNDMIHPGTFENKVSEAEWELTQAREHFKETLRDVSEASQVVVRRVWQSGKPVVVGVAILAGLALLLSRSRARRPLVQIRVIAPVPELKKKLLLLAAQVAIGALVRRIEADPTGLPKLGGAETR